MLVIAVALQLALSQVPQPQVADETASPKAAAAPQEAAPPKAAASAPVTVPSNGAAAKEPEKTPENTPPALDDDAALKTTREQPPPVRMKTRKPKSALVPIPSLLSAEPLGGRSAVLGWAGWSSLGAAWAQGVTNEDDLGAIGDLDWSTGELRLSGFYRRPLGHVGAVEIGARLRAGWYANLGAQWIYSDNMADRGLEFAPGIVLSTRGAGGIFSLSGDLPITVTFWRDGGIFAAPKLSLAFETLLYGDLTVGVRVAGSSRAGAGDAPLTEPRALIDLHVMAGWKIL